MNEFLDAFRIFFVVTAILLYFYRLYLIKKNKSLDKGLKWNTY